MIKVGNLPNKKKEVPAPQPVAGATGRGISRTFPLILPAPASPGHLQLGPSHQNFSIYFDSPGRPRPSTPHARSKWLRGVKIRCKTTYFTYFDHHLQFISDIRRITSHFMLEAAMRKLLCLQLRPIFAPNKPCFFHITTLANPRLLFRYLQKSLNKVLKVFVLIFLIHPQQNYFESNGHSIDSAS